MSDERIAERDLGLVSAAPTDEVRAIRGGKSIRVPAISLPTPAAARAEIDDLKASVGSGLTVYDTALDLPVEDPGEGKRLAWVGKDPTPENNGAWMWSVSGGEWERSDDLSTILASRTSTLEGGEFSKIGFRMVPLHPWTGYGWGVQGSNGLFPIAARLDGALEIPLIESQRLNDVGIVRLDPWTGYSWAIAGSNGKHPIAARVDGTIDIPSISVDRLNGAPIEEALGGRSVVVPDATQEWWISPVHTTLRSPYARIVSGLYGSSGEIIATEFVPGLGITYNVHVATTGTVDDHNAPALWAMDGRRAVLAWTEHNETTRIDIRVSDPDGDIGSFRYAPAVSIELGAATSYTQIHRIEHLSSEGEDVFWMFTRLGSVDWALVRFSVDQATGEVEKIGTAQVLFEGDGQYYVTSAPAHNAAGNQVIRLAAGYNPAAALNAVHYYELDVVTGQLTTPADSTTANVLDGTGLPIAPGDVTPVLADTAGGTDRRLFYVRPGPIAPAIAYAEWPLSDPDGAIYKVAVFDGSSWVSRDHGPAGPRFGYTAEANYIAGVSFPDPCTRDAVLVAYRDVEAAEDVLEEHTTVGDTTHVRTLARRTDGRIARPLVPTGGSPLVIFSSITTYGATWFTFAGSVRSAFRG